MTTIESQQNEQTATSALQDNIQRKGNNAYYFAHAHKANGPEWDGKEQPKLLAKTTSSIEDKKSTRASTPSSFDIRSNITSYAFSDEGASVKLYISLEGVGDKCSDEDIMLDHTDHSFCLLIHNYKQEDGGDPLCLSFVKLTAEISRASVRKKKDRVILTLTKVDKDKEWHTINDKGQPDHEVV